MLEALPLYINLLFGLTVLGTVAWFYAATKSKSFLIVVFIWIATQSFLGLSGIYKDVDTFPPNLILGIAPALLLIILMFTTKGGRQFIDRIDLKTITYFHAIRMPVELVLTLLFWHRVVSVYMTWEGTNFDLFSGISAPLVAFLVFSSKKIKRKFLLAMNIIWTLLLLNVVITAIFSLPTPFQKIGFDQPTIAVLYFPFNLLPTVVVPIVLFSNLAAIRRLIKGT